MGLLGLGVCLPWVGQDACVMHCQLCLQRRALKVVLLKWYIGVVIH